MKKLIVFVVVAALLVVVAVPVIGYYNKFVRYENQVAAIDKDMQNVHGIINNKIKSSGLAVKEYGDTVIKAIEVGTTGRYGKTGVQSAFAWIKEQNPNIDPAVFAKLQTVIEAGYNSFEAVQRTKIDAVRVYKNEAETFPGNLVAGAFGFPKKSWDELGRIVVSTETKRDFERGEMEPIDPFKK
jgi:hypothetical protein